MKKQEFNLSDKEQALGTLAGATYGTKIYYPEDVKEFIRLLKEESKTLSARNNAELKQLFFEKIKELAGDELI